MIFVQSTTGVRVKCTVFAHNPHNYIVPMFGGYDLFLFFLWWEFVPSSPWFGFSDLNSFAILYHDVSLLYLLSLCFILVWYVWSSFAIFCLAPSLHWLKDSCLFSQPSHRNVMLETASQVSELSWSRRTLQLICSSHVCLLGPINYYLCKIHLSLKTSLCLILTILGNRPTFIITTTALHFQ